MDALAVRSDPIHRTTLIHSFAGWHGDLRRAAELLRDRDDAAFRSGLCAALGTIASENMEPTERDDAAKILSDLYLRDASGATHAAAGWALRQWKQELPVIEPASHPPSDRRWFVNGQGMTMVEVPAGRFTMGTAGDGNANQVTAQEVTLTKAHMLADREVTVEQFQRFVDDDDFPAAEKPEGWQQVFDQWKQYNPTPDCPVTAVNWFDAVLYCNWLSAREGRKACYERTGEKEKMRWGNQEYEVDVWRCDFAADGYRLPTEAEWEYACRAQSSTDFCFGSDEDHLSQYAWFVVNAKSRTWPGGAKLPNALGLFDMHGNVWEWCWDWHGNFSAEPVSDPTGPIAG
ncbi:MAG TPA: SUMF1/EgtB/PvdO family nonheme iron enzyme, partial [Pirellulales bacterium]|nr:SUMF1/EgtB/PvdO family nonheme iron enzyme [Pirellulales bacterium]